MPGRRSKRNSNSRQPAVWHGGPNNDPATRTVVHHNVASRSLFSWRMVSGAIAVVMIVLLLMFFSADAFYVRNISVGGLQYLTKEEVFAFSDIANTHIFWVDPQQVRKNLLRSPSIADARVSVAWSPALLQVVVEERIPAIQWEQSGAAIWVDIQGRLMAQRSDDPSLIKIIAESGSIDETIGDTGQIDVNIVYGALQLQDLLGIDILRYNAGKGLGFLNEAGWDVWFGVGFNMSEKVLIYQSIVDSLNARGIQPGQINVSNPDAPYYDVLWGR
ncbi:hypothetical protein MASR2M15_11770 [Anaerolineales bacterium]